jgi:hypothetical protein
MQLEGGFDCSSGGTLLLSNKSGESSDDLVRRLVWSQ